MLFHLFSYGSSDFECLAGGQDVPGQLLQLHKIHKKDMAADYALKFLEIGGIQCMELTGNLLGGAKISCKEEDMTLSEYIMVAILLENLIQGQYPAVLCPQRQPHTSHIWVQEQIHVAKTWVSPKGHQCFFHHFSPATHNATP